MDVVQKARERYEQIKAQIEAADAARPEFERLGAFLKEADEIGSQLGSPETKQHEAPAIQNARSRAFGMDGELTGAMAEKVLEMYGPGLHVNAILERLYEAGWKGSGDRKKDYKNLFNNLNGKPKRFRKVAMATFELIKEEVETEQGR